MKEHGVMFSRPMVEALLAGRKKQTRRLATSPLRRVHVGDRIWVRETGNWSRATEVAPNPGTTRDFVWYAAGGEPSGLSFFGGKMRPAIHMPRWASRLTLNVTDVRFQPLHDITDDDAVAEGIVPWMPLDSDKIMGWHVPGVAHRCKDFPILSRTTPREMYGALWDTLHGSGEWLGNPDVVAVTFEVER